MTSRRWEDGSHLLQATGGAKRVTAEEDLKSIFRLRHEIYAVEQVKHYQSVGQTGELKDPIDDASLNLATWSGGRIAHAVRLSWWNDVVAKDYLASLADFIPEAGDGDSLIVVSRLVTGCNRNMKSLISLFRLAFACGLVSGARTAILSTRPELKSLFLQFGWCDGRKSFVHHCAGRQEVMFLDLYDQAQLTRTSSPLAPILRKYEATACMNLN
ncbi:MAG: hypothetical protein JSR78_16730 [Proteobacteria bacterium]|nr:hypothetical protein [Pseudomonadota bacterium]